MRSFINSGRTASVIPWVVAFIEGFSTLAVEVIAIRLAIPIVGSSITLTGVMLGVVLFALSAGYWRGGALSARWDTNRTRNVLTRNLLLATVLYGAVAFPLEARALEKALDVGFSLPLAIGLTASVLFLLPIYFASQTVPMLAELTDVDGHAGKASGKVLFFSTVGSVAGGIVTPVWLFPSIGVANSTWVVCGLLATAACLTTIGRLQLTRTATVAVIALAVVGAANAWATSGPQLFAFDSAYQSIRIVDNKSENGRVERVFMMGGGRASGIWTDTGETSFAYVEAAKKALTQSRASRVLVIGAAGFNFPRDISVRPEVLQIDAVDVDPAVKRIAEQHFLGTPLSPKVHFLPLSARYAVRRLQRDGRQYGFTLVDAYFGKGMPDELVTVEFFRDVHRISSHTSMNAIMDRDLESAFTLNLLSSFRDAFGGVWLTDVAPGDSYLTNFLVTSWPVEGSTPWTGRGEVYHDDRNSADQDHVQMVW